jgi:hypothetical protein
MTRVTAKLYHADCLAWMRAQPDNSVDLIFTSSPYEAARTYGVDFKLKGQAFVDWCFERYMECVRICRGLVAWVIEGQTRKFRWSATPALLMADLHRAGVKLRKPPAFARVGIPGSGGPDWLRNDYEFIICSTKGKLPWSDNTAMGHPPRWAPGGAMSNRTVDGQRKNGRDKPATVKARRDLYGFTAHDGEPSQTARANGKKRKKGKNQWGHSLESGATVVDAGGVVRSKGMRPSHRLERGNEKGSPASAPVLANPGNHIEAVYTLEEVRYLLAQCGVSDETASDVIPCLVGGGVMGSDRCHENEAPFPEALAEFYVRSFCPEGGTVADIFCGSGTVPKVASMCGRHSIGVDVRASQIELTARRLREECPMFAAVQVA